MTQVQLYLIAGQRWKELFEAKNRDKNQFDKSYIDTKGYASSDQGYSDSNTRDPKSMRFFVNQKLSEKRNNKLWKSFEKLIDKAGPKLAENLINQKKDQLNTLENNYGSSITFEFKDEITLHEPIIEVSNFNKKEDKYSNKNIKNLSKKKTLKKKTKTSEKINSQIKKNISKKKKEVKKDAKLDNKENIENEVVKDKDNAQSEEKTGWWS